MRTITTKEFESRVLVAHRDWDGLDLYLAPVAGAWMPIYERGGVWYNYDDDCWSAGLYEICFFLVWRDFEIVHKDYAYLNLKEAV